MTVCLPYKLTGLRIEQFDGDGRRKNFENDWRRQGGKQFSFNLVCRVADIIPLKHPLSPGFEGVGQPFLAIPILSANVAFPQVE